MHVLRVLGFFELVLVCIVCVEKAKERTRLGIGLHLIILEEGRNFPRNMDGKGRYFPMNWIDFQDSSYHMLHYKSLYLGLQYL